MKSTALSVSLIVAIVGLSVSTPPAALAQRAKVEIVPMTSSTIISIAVSRDGARVLAGGSAVRLWDITSGRLLRVIAAHSGTVRSVAFSPDGTRVLSGSDDKTVKLSDAATGALLRSFSGHLDQVNSVAFSPDGTRVLSGSGGLLRSSDSTLKLWDAATGQLLRTFAGHAASVNCVAFSSDGTRVLSGSEDKTIKLWDASSGQLLRTFVAHSENATANSPFVWVVAAFSPDGTRVLSASPADKKLKLWDVASGRLLLTFEGHSGGVSSVAFSPEGSRVLSGSKDKTVKLWDAATGRLLRTFEGNSAWGSSIAFSPDGTHVLSGDPSTVVKLWDAATGQLLQTLTANVSYPRSVAFPQEGARVITGNDDKTTKLWDVATGQLLRTFEGRPRALSPDGTRAFSRSSDNTITLWDATTARLLRTFGGLPSYDTPVALSPDSAHALFQSEKTMKLWDVASGRVLRSFEEPTRENSVAFSPDGTRVLAGLRNGSIKLWDLTTGRLLRTLEVGGTEWPSSVTFSPDGTRALSGSEYGNGTVKLWDLTTGRLLRNFEGHSSSVVSAAFSPDGTRALSASNDNTMKLWDVATGQLLRTFEGHWGQIHSVAFSPDGTRILSLSNDQTTRIWDVRTGEWLISLIAAQDGESVVITPEGFFTASKKGADLLSVVRGFEVYSIVQLFQALYRPDLVREKLAGDPKGLVREAAAKLDLDKVMASGSAPAVRILSPKEGERVATEQVTAEAEVSDKGGGVGRIEWRVNGLTLGVEARGLARADAAMTVKRALFVEPGDNVVEIIAYNAKGLIASTPASIKVVREGGPPTRPHLHVLAVGVNDYHDSRLQLTYAVSDAKALGEALRKAGDKLYDSAEITTVLDADVTTANLDRVFNEVAKNVRPSDVFVFFLAGHGKTVDGRYYFLPQDFRYQGEESISQRGVGQDRWQEWFARIPARKSILLYDTCESGTLTGDRIAQRGLERVAALDRMTQAMGRTVLTASTDDAPALEGYRGHGVFTYALLDALGRADTNRDGLIEVTGLAAFVDQQVPELSFKAFHMRQIPQMRIVGSNFPLANRIAVLPSEGEASAPVIPNKPTHVVPTAADVFEDTVPGSAPIRRLNAGTGVTLVKAEAGWTLIAREGKIVGYVATTNLLPIQ